MGLCSRANASVTEPQGLEETTGGHLVQSLAKADSLE